MSFFEASRSEEIKRLTEWLDGDPDVNQMSSFFEASRSGDIKRLKEYLDGGADVNQAFKEDMGTSALMQCAYRNHVDCVKLLVLRKANLEFRSCHDGLTALAVAAADERVKVMQFLLDADANINSVDDYGWTPIMWAAFQGKRKAVQLLLLRGADLNITSTVHRKSLGIPKGVSVSRLAAGVSERVNDSNAIAITNLLNSALDLVWSPDSHKHFPAATATSTSFKSHVMTLLILHRTRQSPSDQVLPVRAETGNRFWKVPKPLLFRIISLVAPPARALYKSNF